MRIPKALRWTAAAAGGLARLVFGVWLLRWPLFEGVVRRTIRAQVADALKADVEIRSLGGSLLRGLTARGVVLAPRPGSPLRAASVERLEVDYGFLGAGPVVVRARGAAVALAEGDPESGPFGPDDLRAAEKTARDLEIPVTVHVSDAAIALPDGRTIRVLEGELSDGRLRAALRVPELGRVEAVAVREKDRLQVDATASEGPLRAFHLGMADGRVRIEARTPDRLLVWTGRVERDADGRLTRAVGTLTAPEGRAETAIDFEAGRVEAEIDAALHTEEPLRADWTGTGRLSGPLLGPLEDWTVEDARVRAAGAVVDGLVIDEIVARVTRGGLEGAEVNAVARRGSDWAEFEGTVAPGEPVEVRGRLRGRVRDAGPYLARLEGSPDVRLQDLRFDGRVRFDGRLHAAGRLSTGAGEAWSSLDAQVSVFPDGLEVPALRAEGVPAVDRLELSGALQRRSDGAVDVQVQGRAGAFEGAVDGQVGPSGRVEIRGRIQGPDGLRASPVATVQAEDGSWSARVEPGTIRLPGGESLRHGALEAEGSDAEIAVRAGGLAYGEADLGAIEARLVPGEALEGSLAWSAPSGERLRAEGRWGAPPALDAELRVPDLSRSILQAWIPEAVELRGGVSLDLRLRGTPEAPEGGGRLVLEGVAAGPSAPLSLDVPLRVEEGAVRARLEPVETPYGRLSFDAAAALADGRLSASARLLDIPFSAAAPFVGEAARPWIPEGRADLRARAEGRPAALVWSARLEAWAAGAPVPEPLGRLSDLRLEATADAGGLRLERLQGRLGGGAFEAAGRWDGAAAAVELKGEELMVVDRRLSRVRLSPDLRLVRSVDGKVRIEGGIRLGRVMVHEELAAGGGGAGEAAADVLQVDGPRLRQAPGGGVLLPGLPGAEGVTLDVRVESGRDVRIENSALGAMLDVAGRLRGTLADPSWSGIVRARSGEVRLPAAIMIELDSVELVFPEAPGAEPTLHAEGHVGRGEGSIQIVVDGPLASPTVDLRSTPPLPREELLARLAFGQGRGELSAGSAVGTLAFRVVDQYRARWPVAEPTTSFFDTVKPSLVAAEEAGPQAKPWELPSTRSPRGLGVRAEVLLNEYFSIVTEGDQDANIGGDLKLRLRFR